MTAGFDVIIAFIVGMGVMFFISTYYDGKLLDQMKEQQKRPQRPARSNEGRKRDA